MLIVTASPTIKPSLLTSSFLNVMLPLRLFISYPSLGLKMYKHMIRFNL